MMTNPKSQIPNLKSQISSFRGHPQLLTDRWALGFGLWALAVLAFLLRLAPLGRYVTPDEPAWVYRSIRFADALTAGDWAAIPSTGHPGATTMWLGTAGVAVRQLLNPAESAVHLNWIRRLAWLAPENGEAFRHLAYFLPWGRVVVALTTTLSLVVLYPLLVRLFDRHVALLAVGLLACDPFLIGHSGLLHTDALLATFSLLALVTALNGLQEPRHDVWWALSGLFTGLALLTKTPALILPPVILLLLLIRHLQSSTAAGPSAAHVGAIGKSSIGHWSLFTVHCSLFTLLTVTTCLALYPALWAEPAGTLRTLSAFAGRHVEAVQRPIFFAGQMTYDPGPAFYPVVFLFRISPVVMVGLVIGMFALRRFPSDRRFTFLLLLAFAVGFGALMSLGAKKHDRYLLPAFPPFTLAAALGISRLVHWYTGKLVNSGSDQSANLPIYQSTILVFQALVALAFISYPLTYANPLAGGPWIATRVLSLDWGEGMGATARWLKGQPGADQLTVAAVSVPSFAPLFIGRTLPIDRASLADYIITAPPSYQSTNLQIYKSINLPTYQLTTIYTNSAPFEQADYLASHAESDDLILLDAETPLLHHYTGPGTLVSVADLPDQPAVAARVAEMSAGRSHLWLVADPAASPITAAHSRQALEAVATPVTSTTVAAATISRFEIRDLRLEIRDSSLATFGDQLTLTDALLPADPVNAPFPVFLRWQVSAPTPADLHASLYLRDLAGHPWAEVGQLVLNDVTFPTSAWTPGEWADNALTLRLPQYVPPGIYAIQLTVADNGGAQLGAWDADGQFHGVRVPLGEAEIAPPAEPVGPAPCTEGRSLTAGPLLACAPDGSTEADAGGRRGPQTARPGRQSVAEVLSPQAVPSGDTLTLALTWSAITPPQADYSIRWRLLDGTGSAALEQTTDLSPYTTSRWRAGDTFESRYDLRIDPALPAAVYSLTLNVLAPGGRPLWSDDETLTSVEVLPRDRFFELPSDIAHPLDLMLGRVIHLRGFDLDHTQAIPGDTLALTLYWYADGPTDLNYTVFAHLVGLDGQLHGQVDRFPAAGAAPTTSWAPGQVIVDEMALPVASDAPPGTYHIAVGMYDAASGGRLPIADASGKPLPDAQAILPIEITVARASQ
jgi:hypothetical protein